MRIAFTRSKQVLPLACETIGYDWEQHKVYRPQGYDFYHWLQTQEANGIITVDNNEMKISAGQGILIAPGVPHYYYPDSSKTIWKTAFMTFYGSAANDITSFVGLDNFRFYSLINSKLSNFIQEDYHYFLDDNLNAILKQSSLIYDFLMLLKQNSRYSSNYYEKDPITKSITDYIKKNYTQRVTNRELSRLTGVAVSYMNKVFKYEYGSTPLQFLTEYRLRKAKYLLLTRTDLQVQQIGALVGFNDISRFIQLFKDSNQLTPGEYRMANK